MSSPTMTLRSGALVGSTTSHENGDGSDTDSVGDDFEHGGGTVKTTNPGIEAHGNPMCEGIPKGMPKEMWLEYLTMQASIQADVEKVKIRANSDFKIQELQVRLTEIEIQAHNVPQSKSTPDIRFRRLSADEDVNTYMRAFENLAVSNNWEKSTWARRLAPELTGKAFEAYANIKLEDANNYDVLKQVILAKYNVNSETFRLQFRARVRKPDETIREMVHDLQSTFVSWIEHSGSDQDNASDIRELIVMEQALKVLPYDLTVHLRDSDPKTATQLAEMADKYVSNRGGPVYWQKKELSKQRFSSRPEQRQDKNVRNRPTGTTDSVPSMNKPTFRSENNKNTQSAAMQGIHCFNCQAVGHKANHCPKLKANGENRRLPNNANPKQAYQCENADLDGHSSDAPQVSAQVSDDDIPVGANPKEAYQCVNQPLGLIQADDGKIHARLKKCELTGSVNGRKVSIYRDSMCTQTSVAADLVPEDCYTGRSVTVRGISGPVTLPLAVIDIQCELVSGKVQVAVVPGLHREVLLGHDLDETCGEVLRKQICVLTRQQAKQNTDERQRAEVELMQMAQDTNVNRPNIKNVFRPNTGHMADGIPMSVTENRDDYKKSGTDDMSDVAPIGSDTVNHVQIRPNTDTPMSVTVKRADYKQSRTGDMSDVTPTGSDTVNHVHVRPNTGFRFVQNNDDSLRGVQQRVIPIDEIGDHRVCFYVKDGVLMRKFVSRKIHRPNDDDIIHQVVVPKEYRPKILHTAHDITMAGHMGVRKTKQRVLAHFYWPGVFHDVAQYCRDCPACQMMDKGKEQRKAPLIPMPIIDTPFKRIGIDIVGPMARSCKGHKYLLTICDYATRYPEAIPLSNIRADTVASALLTVFARVGLPEEIVHDQGSNFVSQVMKSICQRLNITQLASTIYHQQTNGVTERFHGTLKNMIRSLSDSEKKRWDEFIPHFLFAYREIPCQSTGFSPFQLLYGRHVRGPLAVIKHNWVGDDNIEQKDTDVVTHLLDMRKRMVGLMAKANQNLKESQRKMKSQYDKNAKHREFEPGDEVLVFLPESSGKLESKWQGPYRVVRKVNKVNYVIKFHNKRKAYRTIHVNMCKQWYSRAQEVCMAECYCIVGDIDHLSSQYDHLQDIEQPDNDQYDMQIENEPLPVRDMEDCLPNCHQTQTWHDISIPAEWSEHQKEDIKSLLRKHGKTFSDVPGRTNLVTHKIKTTTDTPVRQKIYRTPQALREKIRQEIDSMLELGIIEPANSPYASPITVVVKPGGKDIRICSDLRAINKICVFDPYEMPRIDDILDQVSQAKFMSTIDLTKGFYQVGLDPESRQKTAFVSPFGQFQYTVLPFGLQNSSSTFMRLVDNVLGGCQDFAQAYIDDVCIYSNSWSEHIQHLDIVFTRIANAGLTIKPVKCDIGRNEVTYLGHVIRAGSVRPKLDKIQAVQEYPRPVTKKQVRAFLGLSGYYRRFIPLFAEIAYPLTGLTKKQLPNTVTWNETCEQAFTKLKNCLLSNPILCTPNFDKPFILQTDASNFGLGAVLAQIDDSGCEKPVCYLSRKLLDRETRYTTSEKECLAIVWSIGKLRYYLYDHPFTVYSDHQCLIWLERNKSTNSRLSRWFLALQPYQFTVKYKKGVSNTNADGLSRC